jgi:hypothetical protein
MTSSVAAAAAVGHPDAPAQGRHAAGLGFSFSQHGMIQFQGSHPGAIVIYSSPRIDNCAELGTLELRYVLRHSIAATSLFPPWRMHKPLWLPHGASRGATPASRSVGRLL